MQVITSHERLQHRIGPVIEIQLKTRYRWPMAENSLETDPFSYQVTKRGLVQIFRGGKLALTLKEDKASKFLARVARSSEADCQLIMAKATGQFKFGNERAGKERNKR